MNTLFIVYCSIHEFGPSCLQICDHTELIPHAAENIRKKSWFAFCVVCLFRSSASFTACGNPRFACKDAEYSVHLQNKHTRKRTAHLEFDLCETAQCGDRDSCSTNPYLLSHYLFGKGLLYTYICIYVKPNGY